MRALAVLGVVLFHANPHLLGGGFIGVDIFFVISGFLITRIIVRDYQADSFSFRRFYSRRIRRIFPALLITLAATLVFGILFMYPDELRAVSEQSLAATMFSANVYFWMTANYFADSSSEVALLHLWTLGLEEQYYLVWPMILGAIYAARLNAKYLVLIALIISFAINIKYYRWQPEAVFFLPPARFWELLTGSFLAFLPVKKVRRKTISRALREVVSIVSLVILVSSLFLISEIGFPGWQALAPVLSTTLVIWAGPQTSVSRHILSNRILVWVGLISYPLYLYHWPLLILLKSEFFGNYTSMGIMLGIVLSIGLAWLTYRYVESPIRRSRKAFSLVMLAVLALIIFLAAICVRTGWIEGRIRSVDVLRVEEAVNDWSIPKDNYRKTEDFQLLNLQKQESNILVAGDSHASQYYSWFSHNLDILSENGFGVQFATYGGCPLLPDTNRLEAGYGCPEFYDFVFDYAKSEAVDTFMLSVWWEHYFGIRFGTDNAPLMLDVELEELDRVAGKLGDDLERLTAHGKKVIVLLSNPSHPDFAPRNLISRFGSAPLNSTISRTELLRYTDPVSTILFKHLDRPGIQLVDTTKYFCEDDRCPSRDENGLPIYKDSHHLRSSYVAANADFLLDVLGLNAFESQSRRSPLK